MNPLTFHLSSIYIENSVLWIEVISGVDQFYLKNYLINNHYPKKLY